MTLRGRKQCQIWRPLTCSQTHPLGLLPVVERGEGGAGPRLVLGRDRHVDDARDGDLAQDLAATAAAELRLPPGRAVKTAAH